MKNLTRLFILSLPILFSSCVTTFQGNFFQSGFSINDSDFKIIRTEKGTTKATYIFGIGGNLHDGLILEAKQDLYKKCKLEKNQQITNITTDVRNSNIFYPIIITQTVTISADIIEFYPRNSNGNVSISLPPATNTAPASVTDKISTSELIDETATESALGKNYVNRTLYAIKTSKEVKFLNYNSINDVNIGDYVKVSINLLGYTQVVYGRVERISNKSKIVVELEPTPGTFLQEEHQFNSCEKVIAW